MKGLSDRILNMKFMKNDNQLSNDNDADNNENWYILI